MLKEDAGNHALSIAVPDPTMKNKGTVTVEIKRKGTAIISADSNVSAELNGDIIRLTIQMAGTNGGSSCAISDSCFEFYMI